MNTSLVRWAVCSLAEMLIKEVGRFSYGDCSRMRELTWMCPIVYAEEWELKKLEVPLVSVSGKKKGFCTVSNCGLVFQPKPEYRGIGLTRYLPVMVLTVDEEGNVNPFDVAKAVCRLLSAGRLCFRFGKGRQKFGFSQRCYKRSFGRIKIIHSEDYSAMDDGIAALCALFLLRLTGQYPDSEIPSGQRRLISRFWKICTRHNASCTDLLLYYFSQNGSYEPRKLYRLKRAFEGRRTRMRTA